MIGAADVILTVSASVGRASGLVEPQQREGSHKGDHGAGHEEQACQASCWLVEPSVWNSLRQPEQPSGGCASRSNTNHRRNNHSKTENVEISWYGQRRNCHGRVQRAEQQPHFGIGDMPFQNDEWQTSNESTYDWGKSQVRQPS